MPHMFFWGIGFRWLHICALGFCIFNKLILKEYVSQVEGGPHLLSHVYVQCEMTFF